MPRHQDVNDPEPYLVRIPSSTPQAHQACFIIHPRRQHPTHLHQRDTNASRMSFQTPNTGWTPTSTKLRSVCLNGMHVFTGSVADNSNMSLSCVGIAVSVPLPLSPMDLHQQSGSRSKTMSWPSPLLPLSAQSPSLLSPYQPNVQPSEAYTKETEMPWERDQGASGSIEIVDDRSIDQEPEALEQARTFIEFENILSPRQIILSVLSLFSPPAHNPAASTRSAMAPY